MPRNPGDIIGGKFRIVRMIGDGGMGAVYEARHEVLGTTVALKFLHPELGKRQGLATRFLQEARVSASIQSPHVTKVTDVEQTPDGSPYLVMEFLSGESLQAVIDRQRKLDRDQAIDFALQILSGLEAAHALGVVHRDLKPDNVFITPSPGGPVCKLLDFGIAKLKQSADKGLTRPGALMGTPEYMSPEQLYSADRVDHRADLYSLGVLLFEMLAGERPAIGEDASAIVGNVMAGRVKRLDTLTKDLPPALVDVVHRAIDADKARRFQTALDMRLALAPFAGKLSHAGRLAATPVPAGVSTPAPPITAPQGSPDAAPRTAANPPITADEPPLAQPKQGVAPTLPPDDSAPQAPAAAIPAVAIPAAQPAADLRGSTQEAGKDVIAQLAAQNAAAQAVPMQSSPVAAGYAPGPPAPAATPYGQFGPPLRKPQRSGMGMIIALLAGLGITGLIIFGVVWMKQNKTDGKEPIGGLGPAPNTTISAQGGGTDFDKPPDVPQTGPTPDPGPGPKPTATGSGRPPKKDAGADASQEKDAGHQGPWPFPLPSGLPPLPSNLPPLPFPIPGLPPPSSS